MHIVPSLVLAGSVAAAIEHRLPGKFEKFARLCDGEFARRREGVSWGEIRAVHSELGFFLSQERPVCLQLHG